jgi:hypothetical protein
MEYVIYVAVKLILYIAWCWLGLRLWRAGSAGFARATLFGILRLLIGIAFGLAIFFAASIEPEHLLSKYIAIYTPVRMVEWFILAMMIGGASETKTARNSMLWCLGGIVVSFAADFASPEGISGHFCVGRCLC